MRILQHFSAPKYSHRQAASNTIELAPMTTLNAGDGKLLLLSIPAVSSTVCKKLSVLLDIANCMGRNSCDFNNERTTMCAHLATENESTLVPSV